MDELLNSHFSRSRFGEQPNAIEAPDMVSRLKSRVDELEAIIDLLPEAVVVTDSIGHIILLNQAVEPYFSDPSPDIDPQDWPEQFGLFLDDAKTFYPGEHMPLVRALKGESVEAEEMIYRKVDQAIPSWISMSARPINDQSGKITGAIVLFRDITYRKQVELSKEYHARRMEFQHRFSRAIAESGIDLNSITNAVAIHASEGIGDAGIVMLPSPSSDGRKIVAFHHPNSDSRALLRKHLMAIDFDRSDSIFGNFTQPGESLLMPSPNPEQIDAITIPGFKEYVHEVGVQSLLVVPIVGRNGVIGTISLLRDQGGKPYSVDDQTLLTDMSQRTALAIENCNLLNSLREQINERINANKALNVSEERFRSIFESTTLGIKVLDLEGYIIQTNSAFQTMVGRSEVYLIGKHYGELLFPGDVVNANRLFKVIKMHGAADTTLEHRLVHQDGSIIWVKTTFTAVKRGGGDDRLAFIVGIVENITEQKKNELEIKELKNRLQGGIEEERLRLAQELHDGPMQELYSSIYQIEAMRGAVTASQGEQLENIRKDIQQVVEELRSTAKELRPPALADFGLSKAIRSYVQDFKEKHPGIKIHMDLDRDQKLLPENIRLALFRIVQQSLLNVIRHAEADQVKIRFSIDTDEAVLEIRDNGKGFVTPINWISLVRHGHYGLAGAAERIEALGGAFSVESSPHEGATLRVVVPYNQSTKE